MRLTLRTMLAYMDNVLDPQDAEEIGKRIEESEFATNLLHRIRDVMRRLRLGTPSVMDPGAGLDPNTVAEYLDNTLAKDRVPDFEKVCLESDVHLAEVAACHQILALVLGEPVEVDMASRHRMYGLPELARTQGADLGEPIAPPRIRHAPVSGEVAHPSEQPQDHVPEWLREHKSTTRRRRLLAASCVVALCVVLLAAFGQFQSDSRLGRMLGFGRAERPAAESTDPMGLGDRDRALDPTEAVQPAEQEAVPAEANSAGREPVVDPSESPPKVDRGDDEGPRPKAPVPEAVDSPGPPVARGAGAAVASDEAEQAPRSAEVVPPRPEGEERVATAPSERVEPESATKVPPLRTPIPTTDPEPRAALAQPRVATKPVRSDPGDALPAEAGPADAADESSGKPVAPVPPETVGSLDSPAQVLLNWDVAAETWLRLPDQAPVLSQIAYCSLPTYRPVVRVGESLDVRVFGGAQVRFLAPGPDRSAGVDLDFGRLAVTSSDAGASLELEIESWAGVVVFEQADTTIALEASRGLIAGVDPADQPAPLTIDLYVTAGKARWEEDGESVPLNASMRLTRDGNPPEAVEVPALPDWIVADTMSKVDEMASAAVEQNLRPGRPAVLGLRELAQHRQLEVRRLAMRCLTSVGDVESVVAALDSPGEKYSWPTYVSDLRSVVARSPADAARVRAAMEKLHGEEGARLYEMLWKYGRSLEGDDAARLVEYLDHDTLAFRVVSFETLTQITGFGLFYRPEYSAAQRRRYVQNWRDRIRSVPMRAGVEPGEKEPSGDDSAP